MTARKPPRWESEPLPGMRADGAVNIIGYLAAGLIVPGPAPEGYVWDGVKPVPQGNRPELQPPCSR